MKVFLTGAAGQLGAETARALAEAGHDVVGVDRRFCDAFPGRFHLLNLLDEAAAYGPMEGCDALLHVGNLPNVLSGPTPQAVYRENTTTNIHVFQAAADRGITRIAFASSIQACSGSRERGDEARPSVLPYLPLDGHLPPNPGNLYALSKVAGEDQLRYYVTRRPETAAVAIRFPMLVGTSNIDRFRTAFLSGRIRAKLDEGFSYLALADAAGLLRAVIEHPVAGFRILLPAAYGNSLGRPPEEVAREYYPGVPIRSPAGALDNLVDLSEIERTFGWTPRDNQRFDQRPLIQRA